MNGVLGSRQLFENIPQAVYVCARDQASLVTVNIVNRNNQTSAQFSVAITDNTASTPASTDWIEYQVTVAPGGVLSRTGLMISPEQYLVVLSNSDRVNAVCWGVEIGAEIDVIDIVANVGPAPVWVPPSGFTAAVSTAEAVVTFTAEGRGVTYSLVEGALPPGAVLNSTTGVVSGFTAALAAGSASYTFTLRATTIPGAIEDRTFVIAVTAAAPTTATQRAIFGFGDTTAVTNLVSNTGVVATDTTGVGTARYLLAAATYGGDKAIFGYGFTGSVGTSITNLVSNTGVVATNTAGVGSARWHLAAAGYGFDKAIFGYGYTGSAVSMANLVSNLGVVATDTTGVGTARLGLAAAGYGSVGQAIFGYGGDNAFSGLSMTNLVSNTGVVATDTTGVGTARYNLAAASYGTDKAIFGYGYTSTSVSITNLVSNTGVVATDTTGVGTTRNALAAASYGGDRAIFGYGQVIPTNTNVTNLVSNTGVVATDTTGVGTARRALAAAGYSTSTTPPAPSARQAIFAFGTTGSATNISNLVSTAGVVATDTAGVGTARFDLASAEYGGDKAIFGYGNTGSNVSMTNLVSSTGVVATDTTGVGTARFALAAAGYGGDKAIFGFGFIGSGSGENITNLVSNTGVVATNTAGVGTARRVLAATGYGVDQAIFAFGFIGAGGSPAFTTTNITNLVSNTGVVANDVSGVGTIRNWPAGARYGSTGQAIFGYGATDANANFRVSITNLVSNTGVMASDTTGVGTARFHPEAASFGSSGQAIFGYGNNGSNVSMTNIVSNTGVVATDTTGVGTARSALGASAFG